MASNVCEHLTCSRDYFVKSNSHLLTVSLTCVLIVYRYTAENHNTADVHADVSNSEDRAKQVFPLIELFLASFDFLYVSK